jgi:hypothetical protein
MSRYVVWLRLLSCGGLTLAIADAFSMISFSQVVFGVVRSFVTLLITLLFGGNLQDLLFNLNPGLRFGGG